MIRRPSDPAIANAGDTVAHATQADDAERVSKVHRRDSPRALSRRGSEIEPFIVMDVMRRANELEAGRLRDGRADVEGTIIHMEVGQPATPAPKLARQAAARAMETEGLGYTEALGLPVLRQRIAQHYKALHDLDISPERIVVTAGSSAGFIVAFLALFDPGERVALPAPGYPCYRHILSVMNIVPHTLITSAEGRWMPAAASIEQLASSGLVSGVLLASPANPTGTMLDAARLGAIVRACDAAGIWFISDEIYHGLTYEQPAETALRFSDNAVVINSFSKYFSMTGWRIGWMVVPQSAVRAIERLAQNLFICPPVISQYAALGAFDATDELEGHRRLYAQNRALLLDALPKAGLSRIVPADGAFYLYVDIAEHSTSSLDFTSRMLHEIGIAATPGIDFDAERGSQFMRLSYAGSPGAIAEAARRIGGWLGAQG